VPPDDHEGAVGVDCDRRRRLVARDRGVLLELAAERHAARRVALCENTGAIAVLAVAAEELTALPHHDEVARRIGSHSPAPLGGPLGTVSTCTAAPSGAPRAPGRRTTPDAEPSWSKPYPPPSKAATKLPPGLIATLAFNWGPRVVALTGISPPSGVPLGPKRR